MSTPDAKTLFRILEDVKGELQLEANQSILNHDASKGMMALGGMDAVQRIERRLASALGVEAPQSSNVTVLRGRRG